MHEFGPFRYDEEQHLLFRSGEIVPLAPKAVDLLHILLKQRGRVIGKAELMKALWPDTVVEEVGLARNISLLRKALGDDDGECAYIETIPKRGYRFAAETKTARSRWIWWAAALLVLVSAGLVYWQFYKPSRFLSQQDGAPSLAVVPFECLSPELDRAVYSEGLNELIVADLLKLGGMNVVGPSTVRRHQKAGNSMGLMGRLLGLDVLVEGAIQKLGDQLRITARLVDVHTGKLIWSDCYSYPAAGWSLAQVEAAHAIAAQVGGHLAIHNRFPTASH